MNKSLSLVIVLTMVIVITVVITYFDIMDMDRKAIEKIRENSPQTIKLTRHNQHTAQTSAQKLSHEPWSKKKITETGKQFIARAFQLYRNGKLAKAEETVRTALIMLPRDKNALALLGRILYETGRYDLAEQLFREQVRISGSAMAYNNLGEAMARQGRYTEAIEIFNLASEKAPNSATINLNLAGLHSISGNKHQALKFFRQAFKQLGYKVVMVVQDPSLNNIRSEPEFKKIIKTAKKSRPQR
jgi:tetratricopeptide (TPR) repeat protein